VYRVEFKEPGSDTSQVCVHFLCKENCLKIGIENHPDGLVINMKSILSQNAKIKQTLKQTADTYHNCS